MKHWAPVELGKYSGNYKVAPQSGAPPCSCHYICPTLYCHTALHDHCFTLTMNHGPWYRFIFIIRKNNYPPRLAKPFEGCPILLPFPVFLFLVRAAGGWGGGDESRVGQIANRGWKATQHQSSEASSKCQLEAPTLFFPFSNTENFTSWAIEALISYSSSCSSVVQGLSKNFRLLTSLA